MPMQTQNTLENVLIIGAGAAGLMAGYLLAQRGIKFQILEAAATYGGRMRTNSEFADFPLPLGAEWLHADPTVFQELVHDPSISVQVPTIDYQADDIYGEWENDVLHLRPLGPEEDRKFLNGSWLNFYEQYILPGIKPQILFKQVVTSIDYTGQKIQVQTSDATYTADRVIVTIPLKMLQNRAIHFKPALPVRKWAAVDTALVWDGIKVFLEFSEKFYPCYTEFIIDPETDGQVGYFDAAYGQHSNRNILGLFAVGKPAQKYTALEGETLIQYLLSELDRIFNQQASSKYMHKHLIQNWSREAYIQGAYISDHESPKRLRILSESVADKIYFAGEAYTSGEDWGSVHTAAQAAKVVVEELLG